MRLIDADALIKAINPMYISKVNIVADTFAEGCMQFEKLIKEQPTAYDIDKVIEQLEEKSATYCREYGYAEDENILYLPDVIEIVEKGGIE